MLSNVQAGWKTLSSYRQCLFIDYIYHEIFRVTLPVIVHISVSANVTYTRSLPPPSQMYLTILIHGSHQQRRFFVLSRSFVVCFHGPLSEAEDSPSITNSTESNGGAKAPRTGQCMNTIPPKKLYLQDSRAAQASSRLLDFRLQDDLRTPCCSLSSPMSHV